MESQKKIKSQKRQKLGQQTDPVLNSLVEVGLGWNWKWKWSIFLILLGGFVLRTIYLELKPPHFDEGINGFFVAKMWKEGFYHYDPTNFHGPLYFYFLQISEIFFGRTIFAYRFVTGLISVANLVLIICHRRFFGTAVIWAAGVCAVSAGCVFYSRYAIHESLFIFFQILFSYGWFLWRENRSRRAVALMLTSFFALYAIKETYFIFIGTWILAFIFELLWRKWRSPGSIESLQTHEAGTDYWKQPATRHDWFAMIGFGFLFEVALFTGFFFDPKGLQDMVESVMFWTKTGGGGKSGHEKAFIYYFELLHIYEWPILLGLISSIPLFFFSKSSVRMLILFSVGIFLAYSIIPYKTPWLSLNFIWSFALVFGALIEMIRRMNQKRVRRFLLLAVWIGLGVMIKKTLELNFRDFANEKEKYVYVQSTLEMKSAIDRIQMRLTQFPEDLSSRISVLVKDPWPLPWVLGIFPNLHYGQVGVADLRDSSVIFIDGSDQALLEARLTGKFWRLPFQIRDSYGKGWVYLNFEKYRAYVPSDSQQFERAMVEP